MSFVATLLATLLSVAALDAAEPFGMRLRPAPREVASIYAPAIIRDAPTNETSLVARRDGSLELYSITKPESTTASVMRSTDGGLTWTQPGLAFPLANQAYYAIQVLEAADGSMHAVAHDLREGPGGYRGKLYEVYYANKAPGATVWSAPRKIVPGYIGSIRGFIQLRRGRLVLAVARAIPERVTAPKAGPDFGWNDTFVYFSDDLGATWRQSADQLSLELKTPNATRYGAIEPALLELRDGRVWMLVRDRQGRLFQAFSADGGERWPKLGPSPFISSDSPATLLRLRDGKILLLANACQNWSNPRSYAMGGREVLHAAVSADEGKSWRGFREILTEPVAESRGDRGTAYASAAQNSAGKIVVASGQGEGKRAIFAFDPRWLEETETHDDLTGGPLQWTAYGAAAPTVETLPDGQRAVAVAASASGHGGALWNFPIAAAGELRFRVKIPAGGTATFSLSDHFNRIDDRAAVDHAVASFEAAAFADGRWHDVSLTWSEGAAGPEFNLGVDGRLSAARGLRIVPFGVNYLRVDFHPPSTEARLFVAQLSARAR